MIQNRERQILYVDDTEEQRYAMRRILEGAGFKVLEAGTGAEGLAKLHPGILAVVLDVKLPDMSGYEVCRRIKAHSATAAIPVLQISASFADPTLRAQGLSGGADAYVAQPVHPAELLALVEALIRSHDSEKTLRFQAKVSSQLAASLDYDETISAIEQAFIPRFADTCFVVLVAQGKSHTRGESESDLHLSPPTAEYISPGLPSELQQFAFEVVRSGITRMVSTNALIAPLEVARKRIGALVYTIEGDRRLYSASNMSLAEDLADRAALALQNASLYSAQRAAQLALIQSEKLAAAGRLSAAIAHEINNPLESITNLLYLIDTSDDISPTIKGYVGEALSELSRLTHIARQSLGFYRELTGPATFDLNDSVEDTLQIYLKRFDGKHIEVERHYCKDPLCLSAVKGEVRQVISNLLVNAYDALPNNGKLMIQTSMRRDSSGDYVVFSIGDNGPGIPPEVLSRIFEPFFTTKDGTGTGLGLWVSDTIVTKHGGTIEVTSSSYPKRHGTTFEVSLPVLARPAPAEGN
jgi:two-component system NtrC family sensor kinase